MKQDELLISFILHLDKRGASLDEDAAARWQPNLNLSSGPLLRRVGPVAHADLRFALGIALGWWDGVCWRCDAVPGRATL